MIVVDTGVLYAAADQRDSDHVACAVLLGARASAQLVVPAVVVAESSWLIGDRLGAPVEAAFVAQSPLATSPLLISPMTTGLGSPS